MSTSRTTPAASKSAARLLVACARVNLDDFTRDQVRQLVERGDLEWPQVLNMAREHGVLPLVHKALQRIAPQAIPESFRSQLEAFAISNIRRNFQLMSELLKLLATLTAQNVRALPYKGPLLALRAYGDLSLRQAGDLDILVPKADLHEARSLVATLGYEALEETSQAAESRILASAHGYNFSYVKHPGTILMELHWQVAGRLFSFTPNPTEMWDRGETRTVAGTQVRVLSPEDCLLVLCAHGMKHFWTRLAWVCDIAQFVKANPNIHWRKLLHRAADLNARNMTLLGLVLAHRVLDAQVPRFVLALADSKIHAQAVDLEHQLFLPLPERDELPRGGRAQLIDGGMVSSLLFHFRTRENWASGLRYCFHRALTPSVVDQGWLNLPRQLSFMYYILRPLRLVWKYGPFRFLKSGHRTPSEVLSRNQ